MKDIFAAEAASHTPARQPGQSQWKLFRSGREPIQALLVQLDEGAELHLVVGTHVRKRLNFPGTTAAQYVAKLRMRLELRGFEDRRQPKRVPSEACLVGSADTVET